MPRRSSASSAITATTSGAADIIDNIPADTIAVPVTVLDLQQAAEDLNSTSPTLADSADFVSDDVMNDNQILVDTDTFPIITTAESSSNNGNLSPSVASSAAVTSGYASDVELMSYIIEVADSSQR